MSSPATAPAGTAGEADNRLGRRLVRSAFGISLAIGLAVMIVQIVFVYVTEIGASRERLDELARTQVPQLAASRWLVNDAETALILDGIASLPGVAHVVLADDDGQTFTRGARPPRVLAERRFALQPAIPGAFRVGELTVVVGPDELAYKLARRSGFAALTTVSALGACALALLVLFRREVTRHLRRMAEHAATLRLDGPMPSLVLAGKRAAAPPDEIDQLAEAVNSMQARIAADLKRMQRYEAELSAHRDHLEGLVQARTLELEDKARLLEEQRAAIERLANVDALTGAATRRHFGELAERELSRAKRAGETVAVLAMDLDRFKALNDAHGHAGGDAALRAFAAVCRAQLRTSDVFGRIGGEEFAVLLPATDAAAALAVAERIRAALAATPLDLGGAAATPVTVSIGVASRRADGALLEALLLAADEALYAAKRGGRNRVVAASVA